MKNAFEKASLGGAVGGIGIMALGSGLNIMTMGAVGATIATVSGLSLGAKMVYNQLKHGEMFPDEHSL